MLVVDTIETDTSRQLLVPQTLSQAPLSDTNQLTVEARFGMEYLEKLERAKYYCIVGAALTSLTVHNDQEQTPFDESVRFVPLCNRPFQSFETALRLPFELTLQVPEERGDEFMLNFVLVHSSMIYKIREIHNNPQAYRSWIHRQSMFTDLGGIHPSVSRANPGLLESPFCSQKIRVSELCTTGV